MVSFCLLALHCQVRHPECVRNCLLSWPHGGLDVNTCLIVPVNKYLCAGKSNVMGLVFPVADRMAITIYQMNFLGRKTQQKLIITRETWSPCFVSIGYTKVMLMMLMVKIAKSH